MPRSRRHRSSSGNSSDSDSSGTVVPTSSRAPSSARSHRSSNSRHLAATASSRRSNHTSPASRPSSSSASRPPVSSASRSSMVSGTSSGRPSSSHSSCHRSPDDRSSYTASESLSSRHSQAQSSASGTAINARSYASSSRAGTSRVSTNSTSPRRSGISDETVGPWDSVSRVGTPPPSSQSRSTRDRNRVAYGDEPDVCLCFRPPSNDEECYDSLVCARSQQVDKRDYIAELKSQFIEAPPGRLEFILDEYVEELADLIRLELYITSMERYQKRNGREDVRGQLYQISAKYESTMNTKQLSEAMGDIAFK